MPFARLSEICIQTSDSDPYAVLGRARTLGRCRRALIACTSVVSIRCMGRHRAMGNRWQFRCPRWRNSRWHAAAGNPAFEDEFARVPPGRGAAPVNTSGTAFESGVPQRLPFPPSTGVTTTPQSTPDGQRFLIEVPLGSTSGSNVNQRGAQLASVVEAVKTTKTT